MTERSGRNTLGLPGIEVDPLFADAVDDAIAGDASTMPGVQERPVGRDPHDFSSLYVRHRSSFVAHARRYLHDQRDIDEVVQEALLRLFLALPELETELQALAYCRRTVTNLCIDRFRAQKRAPRLVGYDEATDIDLWDDGNVDDPIYAAEDAAIVREALALLSPTHRDALIKREVEEKSLAQIAAEMGLAETAVKHTLHRARRSLRRAIATLWQESTPGVKSALVLILAVLMSLPFLSRIGGEAVPSTVAAARPALGSGTATPTSDKPADAVPLSARDSVAQWPAVPSFDVPNVTTPSPPAEVPGPIQVPPPPSTEIPQAEETATPEPTPPTPPVRAGTLITVHGYRLVAAPSIERHVVLVGSEGQTTVQSALVVPTTDGVFALDQSVTRLADGTTALNFAPMLPQAGGSVEGLVASPSSDVDLSETGSIHIKVSFLTHVAPDSGAADSTPEVSRVAIDLKLSSDLASIESESVVVTPLMDSVGSVDLGKSTPLAAPTDGSPSGGQSQAQLQQPAVERGKGR